MSNTHGCNKKINALTSINEVKIGDVLLFKPRQKLNLNQKVIMTLQSFLPTSLGTNETVHAAICIDHKENNVPVFANVCGSGYKIATMGQGKFGKNYGADRPFVVYRADAAAAEKLAKVAHEASGQKYSYSLIKFIKAIGFNKLNPDRNHKNKIRNIAVNTFCSRFVVDVMKKAWQEEYENYYPNFKANISPKQLEHFLSQDKNFTQLCYVGENNYETLVHSINVHLERLAKKSSIGGQNKYKNACAAYRLALDEIDKDDLDNVHKCIKLLEHMLSVFEQKTDLHLSTPRSYKEIDTLSKRMGLHKHLMFQNKNNHSAEFFSADNSSKNSSAVTGRLNK